MVNSSSSAVGFRQGDRESWMGVSLWVNDIDLLSGREGVLALFVIVYWVYFTNYRAI